MEIDFSKIQNQTVTIQDFCLKSRFSLEDFEQIPVIHRSQINPINLHGTKIITNFIEERKLHEDVPFKKGLFRIIDKAKILDGNEKEISKWLFRRGLPFDRKIILYIDEGNTFIITWKIFIKYFGIFNLYHDDIVVFDENLQWAILVYHENEIYFGTNKDFIPRDAFSEYEFSW